LATAPAVAGIFFPLRETLGFDARQLTPGMITHIVFAAAETRSFKRAVIILQQLGGAQVSDDTVQRVVGDVGGELAERRDADPKTADALAKRPEEAPTMAIVECDGGRTRAREPGHGRGVHLSGENGWRETKNACLVNAIGQAFDEDPQPEPPACFCNPKHVAKLAETEALSIAKPAAAPTSDDVSSDAGEALESVPDWRPTRRVRTVLRPVGDGSMKPCPRPFWAMDYPGIGRFGRSSFRTSSPFWISFIHSVISS
jgi:hypothetical protein